MGQMLGLMTVKQSTVAIKERRFGKFSEVLQPGCHCVPWCCGNSIAGKLSMTHQILHIRCEAKTKDDVFLSLVASVGYKFMLEKASMAFYEWSNTKQQIENNVISVIHTTVASLSMDETYEKTRVISAAVKEALKKVPYDCGIEIVHTLIVAVELSEDTKRALSKINAAAHMRMDSCSVTSTWGDNMAAGSAVAGMF